MGLSKLLTNIDHFEDVIPLTKVGSRKELDITVGDIYGGILSPIDNSLTASNFGKVAITDSNYNSSDILATVQGLVGEVVTALSLQFAETKTLTILFILVRLYVITYIFKILLVVTQNTKIKHPSFYEMVVIAVRLVLYFMLRIKKLTFVSFLKCGFYTLKQSLNVEFYLCYFKNQLVPQPTKGAC